MLWYHAAGTTAASKTHAHCTGSRLGQPLGISYARQLAGTGQLGLPERPHVDDYLAHLDSALVTMSSTAPMPSTLCMPWYLPPQA